MNGSGVLELARAFVLGRGLGLGERGMLEVLKLEDHQLEAALALAHEVRLRWCGEEVKVEGIVSVKTGGCPEDCHFCSQSGRFDTTVRATRLDIPSFESATRGTRARVLASFRLQHYIVGHDAPLGPEPPAGDGRRRKWEQAAAELERAQRQLGREPAAHERGLDLGIR